MRELLPCYFCRMCFAGSQNQLPANWWFGFGFEPLAVVEGRWEPPNHRFGSKKQRGSKTETGFRVLAPAHRAGEPGARRVRVEGWRVRRGFARVGTEAGSGNGWVFEVWFLRANGFFLSVTPVSSQPLSSKILCGRLLIMANLQDYSDPGNAVASEGPFSSAWAFRVLLAAFFRGCWCASTAIWGLCWCFLFLFWGGVLKRFIISRRPLKYCAFRDCLQLLLPFV